MPALISPASFIIAMAHIFWWRFSVTGGAATGVGGVWAAVCSGSRRRALASAVSNCSACRAEERDRVGRAGVRGCGFGRPCGVVRYRIAGVAFAQRAAVPFGGAAAGIGVAAQAQGHRQGEVVRQGQAEGAQGGEPESNDLGDGDEVGVVAGAISVDGLDRGGAGEPDVAGADGEEHRCEKRDDEGHQDVGGAEG